MKIAHWIQTGFFLLWVIAALPGQGSKSGDSPYSQERQIRMFGIPGGPQALEEVVSLSKHLFDIEAYRLGEMIVIVHTDAGRLERAEQAMIRIATEREMREEKRRQAVAASTKGPGAEVLMPLENLRSPEVFDALRAYVRTYPGGEHGQDYSNVTILEASRQLILRDTPERVAEMQRLIEKLQVVKALPKALNFTIRCRLIRAEATEPAKPVEPELRQRLRSLLPHEYFQEVASGLISVSLPTEQLGLNMETEKHDFGELTLIDVQNSEDGQSIQVGRLNFKLHRQPPPPEEGKTPPKRAVALELSTRVTIRPGEYLVVGALGDVPYLLVLTATSD